MDRKINSEGGYTLVEVIMVVAIVGILVSIAVSNFRQTQRVNSIYSDLNMIESFFQEKRLKAFSQKQNFTLTLTSTNVLTSTPDGEQLILEHEFTGGPFTINSRGLVNVGGDFHLTGNDYGASYSCVKLSTTRVRMGKWDGATCDAK